MKGKMWLQKYLMEKSKPEQTKPLQNHQQKYERIHSQSANIIRESVKTKQKSTPLEADEEHTTNVPQNNSLQLGGQEIGQLSFLLSNQPRNPPFPLVLSSSTLPSSPLPFSFLSPFPFFSFLPSKTSSVSRICLPNDLCRNHLFLPYSFCNHLFCPTPSAATFSVSFSLQISLSCFFLSQNFLIAAPLSHLPAAAS